MSTDEVRDGIYTAFAGTSTPHSSDVVYDNSGDHLECEEVRGAFEGRAWHEIPLPELTFHAQALFFFTPTAWAYYLPAYLLAVIEGYSQSDSILGAIVSSLLTSQDPSLQSIRVARVAALTHAQREAAKAFFEWVRAYHPDDVDEDELTDIIFILNMNLGHVSPS